ncbi:MULTISPECIES: GNAT family N-acetyltransferase [Burkholderia]|uniref:GNAT family N-acetyltransferase n=1 Tax=Burkholderia TaxID=32008 RepID=UPI0009F58FB6|nr:MULTISPECIES: GNAT family N-acetyltransferase [unclassified Burkholderia]
MPAHPQWSTIAARKHAVRTFIDGYCAARNQITAIVTDHADGFAVRFNPEMGREYEHFMIEGAAMQDERAFAAGAWITQFGTIALPQAIRDKTCRLAAEHFMVADIARLAGSDELAASLACALDTDIEHFNACGKFPPFRPNPRAFLFAHRIDGQIAATARYGFASDNAIVIDRVGTADTFRRRGLASQLLKAIVSHARHRGAQRAWLVSTDAGEPLYRSAGFANIASVIVDQVMA